MELAGKYIDLKPLGTVAGVKTDPVNPGAMKSVTGNQLEVALDTLMQRGFTFEEAFGSLMSGQDLRPIYRNTRS